MNTRHALLARRALPAVVVGLLMGTTLLTTTASAQQAPSPKQTTTPVVTSTTAPVPGFVDRGIVVEVPEDSPEKVDLGLTLDPKTVFSIAVYENGSTGYSWRPEVVTGTDGSTFEAVDDDLVLPNSVKGMAGAGGTHYYRYRTLRSGEGTVKLTYQRSWEQGQPARTVVVHLTVR